MKDISHYMQLPYTVILTRDEEGGSVARVDELPGCSAHGRTPAAALKNLDEAKKLWVLDCLESGDPVPEPVPEPLPSGKWVQRVPRSLHHKLVSVARQEGVSLNQLITSMLSEAVGMRKTTRPGKADRLVKSATPSRAKYPTIEDSRARVQR